MSFACNHTLSGFMSAIGSLIECMLSPKSMCCYYASLFEPCNHIYDFVLCACWIINLLWIRICWVSFVVHTITDLDIWQSNISKHNTGWRKRRICSYHELTKTLQASCPLEFSGQKIRRCIDSAVWSCGKCWRILQWSILLTWISFNTVMDR